MRFDYETQSTYAFEVTATDDGSGGGSVGPLSGAATVTVQVTNANDAPKIMMPGGISELSVGLGAQPDGEGTVVGVVMVRDDDLALPSSVYNETVVLVIVSGNDDATWALSDATRYKKQMSWNLMVANVPSSGGNLRNANHVWTLTFRTQDRAGESNDHVVRVVVQNGNLAPSMNGLPTFAIDENAGIGTLISQLEPAIVSDTESDPMSMYITNVGFVKNVGAEELQPGQIADTRSGGALLSQLGFFANDTHPLSRFATMGLLDYERITKFDVFVSIVDDPTGRDATFIPKITEGEIRVMINDVNEPPVFVGVAESAMAILSVPENSATGHALADMITAKDPDADTILTFTLFSAPGQARSSADKDVFAARNAGSVAAGGSGTYNDANNNKAQLIVAKPTALDFESTRNSLFFGLRASDGVSAAATTFVNVTVTDVPEPPRLSDATVSVFENDREWRYCIQVDDPDAKNDNRFGLGSDAASLELGKILMVDPNTGCLSVRLDGPGFDYENMASFEAQVEVVDEITPSFKDTATLTVTVKDALDIQVTSMAPMTLPTSGGVLVINGTNFGPTAFKLANDPIFYGAVGAAAAASAQNASLAFSNPSSGLVSTYASTSCEILAGTNTALRCVLPEGVGKAFTWTLRFGDAISASAGNRTIVFDSAFAFDTPVLSAITIAGGNGNGRILATRGGTRIVLTGQNFGPRSLPSSAIEIKYARGLSSSKGLAANGAGYTTTMCNVSISHTEIECLAGPGVGAHLEFFISNLAGAQSNVLGSEHNLTNRSVPRPEFTARYEAPIVGSVRVKGDGISSAITSPTSTTTLDTQGGVSVEVVGDNFGPAGSSDTFIFESSEVTYGPSGTGYTATDCFVSTAQTVITCNTAQGTGANHSWIVTRGDQRSSTDAHGGDGRASYSVPSVLSVSGLTALSSSDTQGGQVLTIHGSNFGQSIQNAITGQAPNIRVLYGNPALPAQNWFPCTGVGVVRPSSAISCIMSPGTGASLSLVVIVEGQFSAPKVRSMV